MKKKTQKPELTEATAKVNVEPLVIAKIKGINKIVNYIANELDGDSRISLNIEKGHIWIEHFNGLEKVGHYEPIDEAESLGKILKIILLKEKEYNSD